MGRKQTSAIGITVSLACTVIPATEGLGADSPVAAPVQLANSYDPDTTAVGDYWISEKYDGVRAYWNGRELLTRSGRIINAPAWFTAGWPAEPLDGELWVGRGRFEAVVATVRDFEPDEDAWRRVKFMAFDLPGHPGPFGERKQTLERLLATHTTPWIARVAHWRATDHAALMAQLANIVAGGGEGLMLHRDAARYHAARSDDLLKLKQSVDAEARVIGHIPGNGKYAGLLGSLEVQTSDGTRFRIGTGFTDAERAAPPPIGAWITYRHHGLTARGVPRFPSFVRVRQEEPGAATGL
jgi:DNA ligase-1